MQTETRFTEHAVLKTTDLLDGEMRQVDVGPFKILVAKVAGRLHAVGGTCPHYGAPLAEGLLCGEHVVCPWHQSHFSVVSGKLQEPPAIDDLPRYAVRVEGQDVLVRVPEAWCDRVTPRMGPSPAAHPAEAAAPAEPAAADGRTFLILGAGAAGYLAAQSMREAGYRGRVVLAGPEPRLPYDRPNLSKDYFAAKPLDGPLPLRDADFYATHGIELRRARATGVDPLAKTVAFDDGPAVTYDALLIVTGGTPRRPGVPGAELENVLVLRSLDDANTLVGAARPGMRAVVVGAGFVGMEAAAGLVERGLSVTVVAPEDVPFQRALGAPVGKMFQQLHEGKGVRFRLGAKVDRFEAGTAAGGKDKAVAGVKLSTGEALPADVVLVGMGITLNTDFLRASGGASRVAPNDDGTLNVDENLRLLGKDGQPLEGVWAAGDVTRFPHPQTGEPTHVEHWRLAQQHGRSAAFDMAGRVARHDGTPFFWTYQFGLGLDYVGYADAWDEIVLDGSPSSHDFTAFYVRGGKVLAAAGCGRSRQMCALSELLRLGRAPAAAEVRRGPVDFVQKLKEAAGGA